MGPMRFPVSVTNSDTNETVQINDHRLVFQVAAKLNEMNGNDSSLAVNFIPWIQSSANEPVDTPARRPDGTVPGAAEVAANSSLAAPNTTYVNATLAAELTAAYDDWLGNPSSNWTLLAELGKNVFKAHKAAVDAGNLDYSEAEYLRYVLGANSNISDQIAGSGIDYDSWFYDDLYFIATEWRTIDQGLSRLPQAFGPQVLNRTRFNTTISEMTWDEESQKMSVGWRDDPFNMTTEKEEFDYVITAVPFSKVRLWRLPEYSDLLSRAIDELAYEQSCKVALHYETRFWEHLEYPM